MTTPAWLDREAWPWEARYVDVGEGRMAYVDVGQGPVVVLSHGTPTWGFEWRHVIRALAPTHRVIAPDHLGFGLSERPAIDAYRPEDHAARFGRFLDALVPGRFALVAHDFGGPFALPAALDRRDRLDALAILNSFAWSFDDDPRMRRLAWLGGTGLWRLFYGYLNFSVNVIGPSAWGDRKKLTPAIQAQIAGPWPDVDGRQRVLWALSRALAGSGPFYETIRARLPELAGVPAAVVWGLADSAFQPTELAKWRQALPHAQVTELAGAGHWPHEEAPDVVIEAIRALLRPVARE